MGLFPEYSATCWHTSVAGICWYPAKRTGRTVNQGGTADSVVPIRPWQRVLFCRGRFCFDRSSFDMK